MTALTDEEFEVYSREATHRQAELFMSGHIEVEDLWTKGEAGAVFRHARLRSLKRSGTVARDPACAAAAAGDQGINTTSDVTSPSPSDETSPSHHRESGPDAAGEVVRRAGDLFGENTVSGPAVDA
eukprot:CAMPEP_0179908956 /NCGR_PEP_ID=MMETSP0982-20121206/44940_1 /TAXON_ID=483367 /ORGANISM="non described non described, Strain CCMP 2436" /LENGTH=125 /DNA_ID=CAMNT_0021810337 /DNA_START=315 /DNA_END=688 /DNA_ORIENTATION=+